MVAATYDQTRSICTAITRPHPRPVADFLHRTNFPRSYMSANLVFFRSGRAIVYLAFTFAALPNVAVSASSPPAQAVSLNDAMVAARSSRAEMRVSAARVDAARQRPTIVSSLEDPIIAPSIDHKPVDPMMKTDRSITFEQSFPLSRIRAHRRRAAEADVDRYQGEGGKTTLKIEAEVAQAFFMLNEKRKVTDILGQQVDLAAALVKLAVARHGVGAATQADVLRLEIEEARLRSRQAVIRAEIRAAEAMFNTAMGLEPYRPVPALLVQDVLDHIVKVPDLDSSLEVALNRRPELSISKAEIQRARAEVDVMKSMYAPMAMVRVGMADTETGGRGYMLMVGVSVPIWFGKLKAGVREANAMTTMAEADREAMLRMIHGDVAATLESLRGATLNFQAYQTNLMPRAQRAIAPAMTAYGSGTLPLTSVLEASKALWSVQEESVMAETALGMAWIRHRSAMGSFGESK
jgi:cobalt-zinc-cadmium efflux system outer membrane protein